VRKHRGHEKRHRTVWQAGLAEDKTLARIAQKAVSLHLASRLPMGLAEAGQQVIHQDRAQKQPGGGADPDNQMHDGHITEVGDP
jgi:hypothetical protein